MDENDFEGSTVLEQLAELDLLDDFFEAVESDDHVRAIALLRKAQIDEETIRITIKKMQQSDFKH